VVPRRPARPVYEVYFTRIGSHHSAWSGIIPFKPKQVDATADGEPNPAVEAEMSVSRRHSDGVLVDQAFCGDKGSQGTPLHFLSNRVSFDEG
jgi:hypothetical protein